MEQTIELEDGTGLFVRIAGNGAIPVVFIPGLGMNADVFDRQLAQLGPGDRYRAIAYDPRGQGRSDKPATGHTYRQHARDLQQLLQALEVQGAVLAGWSFGVLAELAYLARYGTDNLRGLAVIDGAPCTSARNTSREWAWYRRDDADHRRRWHTLTALEDPARFRREFARWMLEDPSPAALAQIEAMLAATPPEVIALLNETGAYLDFGDTLAAAARALPLLVVVRAEWQVQASAWCARNAPTARLVAFGSHLMFRERADEFNALLGDFLAELD